ncbi:MAG: gas vesicle protein GvpJ [Actinopolymorphaceae bacterium]
MSERRLALDDGSLVDVLDRLLDVGAYLDGTVLLTLADVDLVRLDLRLLLASVDTLRADDSAPAGGPHAASRPDGGRPKPAIPTPDVRTPDVRTPDVRTPDARTPDARTPDRQRVGRPASNGDEAASLIRTESDLSADRSGDPDEDGDDRQAGIAGLVVVLVDIVRQLLERQALRRMDAGSLTDVQVERLGRALMALEQQTAELTAFVDRHHRHSRTIDSDWDLDPVWPMTDPGRRAHR